MTRARPSSPPASPARARSFPDGAAAAIAELTGEGLDVRDFSYGQPSLDEVFLALTGRAAKSEDDGDEKMTEQRPTRTPRHWRNGRWTAANGRRSPTPCRPRSPTAGGCC